MDLSKLDFTSGKNKKTIKYLVFAIITVIALFVFLSRTGGDDVVIADEENGSSPASSAASDQGASETSPGIVIVDVSGAVKEPQVVELRKGDRISDAIDACGGLTEKADISTINRASIVNDGDKILIPEKGQDGGVSNVNEQTNSANTTPSNNSQTAQTKISINSADSTQLQQITGVGPVTAEKIIDYREQNGAFTKLEDLKNIDGIGDKTFEKMQDQITL